MSRLSLTNSAINKKGEEPDDRAGLPDNTAVARHRRDARTRDARATGSGIERRGADVRKRVVLIGLVVTMAVTGAGLVVTMAVTGAGLAGSAPVAGAVARTASVTSASGQSVAYLANFAKNQVTPVNLVTRQAGAPIRVGIGPDAIAISPDGAIAYVACAGSDTVVPIDTATGKAGKPISVGVRPSYLAITPDGSTAYVADNGSSQVTPIDLTTGQAGPAIAV